MEEQRKESKYAALCSDLREQIQQGIFGSGDKLPSEGTLSERYACSRQTVRQALNFIPVRHVDTVIETALDLSVLPAAQPEDKPEAPAFIPPKKPSRQKPGIRQ